MDASLRITLSEPSASPPLYNVMVALLALPVQVGDTVLTAASSAAEVYTALPHVPVWFGDAACDYVGLLRVSREDARDLLERCLGVDGWIEENGEVDDAAIPGSLRGVACAGERTARQLRGANGREAVELSAEHCCAVAASNVWSHNCGFDMNPRRGASRLGGSGCDSTADGVVVEVSAVEP
jgi:hypothetical protein